ncbi:DNA-protecting protein DprA, partial [bacterium]|nr:DNA-protecting protein DprA [bacterium]
GALDMHCRTVAVMGTGLDQIYPARHKQLAEKIVANGCLVSELVLGSPAKAVHFPRRNRIISGLSLGVVVVEAAKLSGSLITARFALEQGREVFAIPGSIHDPLAKGCNALIRDGAKLVQTVTDILEEFPRFSRIDKKLDANVANFSCELENDHKKLLKSVAYSPTSIDTLVQETGESPEMIASSLLVLELQGYVQSSAGGRYYRLK